jgi:hypothetical protein
MTSFLDINVYKAYFPGANDSTSAPIAKKVIKVTPRNAPVSGHTTTQSNANRAQTSGSHLAMTKHNNGSHGSDHERDTIDIDRDPTPERELSTIRPTKSKRTGPYLDFQGNAPRKNSNPGSFGGGFGAFASRTFGGNIKFLGSPVNGTGFPPSVRREYGSMSPGAEFRDLSYGIQSLSGNNQSTTGSGPFANYGGGDLSKNGGKELPLIEQRVNVRMNVF